MSERCPRCDRPECPGWAYVGGIRVCYTPDAVNWRARALAAEEEVLRLRAWCETLNAALGDGK